MAESKIKPIKMPLPYTVLKCLI